MTLYNFVFVSFSTLPPNKYALSSVAFVSGILPRLFPLSFLQEALNSAGILRLHRIIAPLAPPCPFLISFPPPFI